MYEPEICPFCGRPAEFFQSSYTDSDGKAVPIRFYVCCVHSNVLPHGLDGKVVLDMKNIHANQGLHGKWEPLGHRIGFGKHPHSEEYRCSLCGYEAYTVYSEPPDRCPNCWAKMDGGKDDA